jgi:hypothetical protein
MRQDLLAAQAGIEWLPERAQLEQIARTSNLMIVDVSQSPQWTTGMYRDGVAHPTDEGNAVLAKLLTGSIEKVLACETVGRGSSDSLYVPLNPSASAQLGCMSESQVSPK